MMQSVPERCLVINGHVFDVDRRHDIALPITPGEATNAFSLPPATFEPFRSGGFVGSVEEGGPVRCDVVTLTTHGNGTHTECVGHIAGRGYTVDECMHDLVDTATLVSVEPTELGGDLVVSRNALQASWTESETTTLVLRTLPNDPSKRTRRWSSNNPPYIHIDAMDLIVERGVRHLMVDVPSVDREEDQGAMVAHRRFWQWPDAPRTDCTITELIFIPNNVPDGFYAVMFNVAPFHGDAAPSSPVLLTLRV
jgi:arylformamidase